MFNSWWLRLTAGKSARARGPAPRPRRRFLALALRLEQLEDRTVPSSLNINGSGALLFTANGKLNDVRVGFTDGQTDGNGNLIYTDPGSLLRVVFKAVKPIGVFESDLENRIAGERQPVAAGREANHAVPGSVATGASDEHSRRHLVLDRKSVV